MKREFSTQWIASSQPRKQRKYRANCDFKTRHKLMSINLSKDLRKRYNRRSFPPRKGDNVKIMRGGFSGKTGKINIIDPRKLRLTIDGIQLQKKEGTKVNVSFVPSNLQIIELNLEDKRRLDSINKQSSNQNKPENKKLEENKNQKNKEKK